MKTASQPIGLSDLQAASRKFQEIEKRGSFYDLSRRLLVNGYDIEAYVLLLATWNFASFRYAATEYDIDGLKNTMQQLDPHFGTLHDFDILGIDLSTHRDTIRHIYTTLANMKEVLFTGATKLMHLKAPHLFVIWDNYIRGGKPERYYRQLECVSKGQWCRIVYAKDAEGYLCFLKDMQDRFAGIKYPAGDKTLAKAIDEYNYVNVTKPIQAMEQAERDAKAVQNKRIKAALRKLKRAHTPEELEAMANQSSGQAGG